MEENKENVVEETTQEQKTEETPQVDESKFESAGDDTVIKVDLSKPPKSKQDAVPEQSTNEVPVRDGSEASEEVQKQDVEETNEEPTGEEVSVQDEAETVLEEVTEEEVQELQEQVEEAVAEAEATGKDLPEEIQKLVDFMEDTGGDLNDYVKLNTDYTDKKDADVLQEYYRQTKPHLDNEEIDFLLEDQFSYDADVDEDRDIKRKKLALKEQVAQARQHLEDRKSKYYEEIKAGSKLTTEQQKAIDFFNRYEKESKESQRIAQQQTDTFLNKTNQVFNDKFKGFEYNVGDKKFRFNVKNVNEVKNTQSDINNFVKKFLNKHNQMENATGYHKSLFTAMNPDVIANHFYEQGKADAIKEAAAKAKNVNINPRKAAGEINMGGVKFRVLGDNSDSLKFKIKNKN
tara:strand:- start:91 stop:1299 length:1209 start_codon:yes stop_codon:yes gene_type:complete